MPRIAWFSPMLPVRTGVATYSAQVIAGLAGAHLIDVYVDGEPPANPSIRSAHDFVWANLKRPYDLNVYQLGNSSYHDFIWPYVFRYPGMAVLHDAHLHHARAAALLRTKRPDHYRAEFAANHPESSPDLAELAVAGFDNHLHYSWPMTRLVVESSRATAVHAPLMAEELRSQCPAAIVETIRMSHGEPPDETRAREARSRVRTAAGVTDDNVLFAVFGGLSPEKRVPQVLDAFEAILPYEPGARLMLAGAPLSHYDVAADVRRRGLGRAVTLTGYLEDDAALTDHLCACDVSINLRWPTAREMSGPWLRALAAGRPTVTIDLAHLADVPSLDPRSWTVVHASATPQSAPPPVTVAIDILDEAHSLRLAMRALATDASLRRRVGSAGRAYWEREHSPERMIDDYQHTIERAMSQPAGERAVADTVKWPAHLFDSADGRLRQLLRPFDLALDWSKI